MEDQFGYNGTDNEKNVHVAALVHMRTVYYNVMCSTMLDCVWQGETNQCYHYVMSEEILWTSLLKSRFI
jgi:hypothetical protein